MSYRTAKCRRKRSKKRKRRKEVEATVREPWWLMGQIPLAPRLTQNTWERQSRGYGFRWGERGKSLKSSQKWYPDSIIRKPGEKPLLWDGSAFLVTGMLLLPLSAGFQAVLRVSIETVATLVSAEKIVIYWNYDKSSIKSNTTALHFIFIHPTAKLLWRHLDMGIFLIKSEQYLVPLGCFSLPPFTWLCTLQKASSWKNFSDGSYCFLFQVKKKKDMMLHLKTKTLWMCKLQNSKPFRLCQCKPAQSAEN